MKPITIQIATLAAVCALAGCASLPGDDAHTVARSTAVGAGGGAAVGGIIGAIAGGKKGAVIGTISGAFFGGFAGYVYGSQVVKQRATYPNGEAYRQACVGELKKARTTVAGTNAKNRREIDARKKELQQLLAQEGASSDVSQKAAALKSDANAGIKTRQDEVKQIDALIADHDGAIQDPQNADIDKTEWKSERAKLSATRAEVLSEINVLEKTAHDADGSLVGKG